MKCRDIVANAIREGNGIDEIVARLEREGIEQTNWHRETVARVETAVLFEYGQQAEYMASPMVAGWEYVAVIDSMTSDICDWMDGRRFRKDDADGAVPPLHYNCRSTTEPIFIFDDDGQWEDPREVLADARQNEKPLPGFGNIDYGTMPQEEPREELYRKLDASGSAKARKLAEELRGKAQAISPRKENSDEHLSTAQEAQKWLAAKYPDMAVAIDNMDAQLARAVASELDRLLNEYGSIVRPPRGVYSRSTESRVFEEASGCVADYSKVTLVIQFQPRFFCELKKFSDEMRRSKMKDFRNVSTVEGVVSHEFGHHIYRTGPKTLQMKVANWISEYREKVYISGYANAIKKANYTEYYAEAFSGINHKPRDQWTEAETALADIFRGEMQ